jgi:hypothetical protein
MALGTQTHGKMLDYEQFIDHQLARTQSKIKTTDILIGCLTLATAFIAVLFLEIVLDHAVGLPIWARQVILLSGIVGAAVYSGYRIARPLLRRVNGFYAAKTIEDADPHFKNSLINYLDLRKHRDVLPRRVLRAIEAKAVGDLTKVEIDTVVNQKRLLYTWYALMGVIMVVFVYYGFAPKSVLDSAKRAFLADVVRPTNTRLDSIKPGDDRELSQVVAGTHVPFSVEAKGVIPEKVTLHYSIDGGQFYLTQDFAPGKYNYEPWQTQLRNAQQSIEYFITGGDAESRHYRVKVLPAPMVTGVKLDFEFPKYTGVAPRLGVDGGAVDAIEKTIITVHATTNQPVGSAQIDMGKQGVLPMDVDSKEPTSLLGKFQVELDGSYTIKFKTTGGQMNPDPVVYDIRAIKDLPPTVRFVSPEPRIKLPSNGKVALKVEAGDDYGVKALNLNVIQGSEGLVSRDILENRKPERKFNGTEILDLANLKLKPGTQVEYWLVARDTKEPTSNSSTTEKQIIEIVAPLPPDQLARLDEKIQKENPPTQPEEQPKGEKDNTQEQVQNGPPKKDTEPQGKNGEINETSMAQGENRAGEPPPASTEPNPPEKPMSPEEQKKFNDINQNLKKLENPNQDNPQPDPNNANQPQPPNPNPNTPPGTSPPKSGADNSGTKRPNDVSTAPKSPPSNPNNAPNTSKPSPSNPSNTPPSSNGSKDVSRADSSAKNQPNSNPAGSPPVQKPQDSPPTKPDQPASPNPSQPNPGPPSQPQAGNPGPPQPNQPGGDPQKADQQPNKPGDPQKGDQQPGKPGDPQKGDQQPGKPGNSPDGKSGDPQKNNNQPGKPGDPQSGKPGDPQANNTQPGKPGDPQKGENSSGKPGDPQKNNDQPGKLGDPQKGNDQPGKPGDPQKGENSSGKPGDPQRGNDQPGKPGDPQKNNNQAGKPGDPQKGNDQPGKPGDPQKGKDQPGKPGDPQKGENSSGKPGDPQKGDPQEKKPGNREQGKPGDSQSGKPGDPEKGNSQESKPGDPQKGEPQPGNSEDRKPDGSSKGDSQPGTPKQGNPGDKQSGKPGDPQKGEPQPGKPGDPQNNNQPGKPGDSQKGANSATKSGDPQKGEAQPGKTGDPEKGEAQPGKPGQPQKGKPEAPQEGEA